MLDHLVAEGLYPSRAEAIRFAIRDLLLFHKCFGVKNRRLYLEITEEEITEEIVNVKTNEERR